MNNDISELLRGEATERRTVSVEEAGKVLGLCRNSAYAAARRGEIPVIRIGRLIRVPILALERLLRGEFREEEDLSEETA